MLVWSHDVRLSTRYAVLVCDIEKVVIPVPALIEASFLVYVSWSYLGVCIFALHSSEKIKSCYSNGHRARCEGFPVRLGKGCFFALTNTSSMNGLSLTCYIEL